MKIEIWSKLNCPACTSVKSWLTAKGHGYNEKILGIDFELPELLEAAPGASSFPQIFVNGTRMGSVGEFSRQFDQLLAESKNTNVLLLEDYRKA